MKLLITGFTPFNGEFLNPAYEVIKLIPDRIGNIELIKKEIDTSFDKSFKEVKDEIDKNDLDYILLLGQAGGRENVTIEKIAINYIDSTISDNDGIIIKNAEISTDGNDAYFSTLNILDIIEYLKNKNLIIKPSYSAGTFVCNYLFYKTLEYTKSTKTKVGFIHIPYIKEQVINKANKPYMELDDIKNIIIKVIESLEA